MVTLYSIIDLAVPGHPAVVDGDDADGGAVAVPGGGGGDVEEGEDVAWSAVRARELEVTAGVGEEDEALWVAQLHRLAAEPGQDGGILERS